MSEPGLLVLDAYAILAVVEDEPAAEEVMGWWKRAREGQVLLAMSVINVGEVVYNIARRYGEEGARNILAALQFLPIQVYEATYERVLAAAHFKARYPISYADAFAAALAEELHAPVLTGDPEFKAVEGMLQVLWLKRN